MRCAPHLPQAWTGLSCPAEPDNARAHDHLGVALELKGDFNGAIASFGRAIALDPTDERVRQHLKEITSRGGVLY